MRQPIVDHMLKALYQDLLQPLIHHFFLPEISLHHSKYEAVTPPAFARMSGIMNTPFSPRMSSANAVVGPFAPSHTIRAEIFAALWLVITFSVAAGIRMSHGIVSKSAPG